MHAHAPTLNPVYVAARSARTTSTGTAWFIIDNSTRTVVGGWQLPPTQTWWQRAVATFTPTIDLPSLHLRNVSNNNGSNNYIGVDDWWVRLAVDAPTINLGPEETR